MSWRLKFAPTIAFIIGGVLSTVYLTLDLPSLSPEIFVSILLPPILFQEALHIEIDGLVEEAKNVFAFAVLGTVMMQVMIALTMWGFLGFSLVEALLFGILIAPTDPVSVIRVFQSLGVNRRFRIIVSGESLFNDGVAIVIYSTLITIATMGAITLLDVGLLVVRTILGGIIIGLISGYLIHTIFSWTDDKSTEVLVSFIAAFGVFRVAEGLHASGVLAIVISGLIINYRTRTYGGFNEDSFEMLEALWEFIGYLASSLAFIFIGTNLDQNVFFSNFFDSITLLILIISFRFIMVETTSILLVKTGREKYPGNWRRGFVWSGLRGAVSIVLVLGTAGVMNQSDVMIALTFGIVVLSNIIQGLSMGWVVRSLNLVVDTMGSSDTGSHRVRYSEHYDPEGYRQDQPRLVKFFFSAPEYFIKESKFGSWISNKIIYILFIMNRYLINRMSSTKGIMMFIVKKVANILLVLLSIINRFFLRI